MQGGLLAELPNSNGLDRSACPSLPPQSYPVPRFGEDGEAVKQRMMGSTCSAALKMKQLSQVELLSPFRP